LAVIKEHIRPKQRIFADVIDVLNPDVEEPELVRDRILRTAEYIPIKVKKHKLLAKSYFKYGLDWVRDGLMKTIASAFSAAFQPFFQAIDNIKLIYQA
jgi:hypothetical protein